MQSSLHEVCKKEKINASALADEIPNGEEEESSDLEFNLCISLLYSTLLNYWPFVAEVTQTCCDNECVWVCADLSSICLALLSTADLFSSTWTIRLSNSHCWSCRAFPICTTLKTWEITASNNSQEAPLLTLWAWKKWNMSPLGDKPLCRWP